MRITKANRVVIEITNECYGMLEQGGIFGHVESYPLADVIRATGLVSREDVEAADQDDEAPAYEGRGITIAQAIDRELVGRVIRRGHEIQ